MIFPRDALKVTPDPKRQTCALEPLADLTDPSTF